MKVVLAGSGNVASLLGRLIHNNGHEIVQVASRNIDHAKALASKFNADAVTLSEPQFADADIYIIALSDVALDSIEKVTGFNNKLVVHTAGSISIEVLKKNTPSYGSLYPLQTLNKVVEQIPGVPFLVDGSSKEVTDTIIQFAGSLSDNIITANDQERLRYHIAAVFVGNFTNHLYAVAEGFCKSEKINFKNLLPLINEVTARLDHNSPYDAQTGPAIREDIFTLTLHLQTLIAHPHLKYLYLKLSESILKVHEKRR